MGKITILGSGAMGKGIALEYAKYGHQVVLVSVLRDLDQQTMKNELLDVALKYKLQDRLEILDEIFLTSDYSQIEESDLVLEVVKEDLMTKREVIKKALEHSSLNTVFATNTSSLSIEEIFKGLINLENVVGLHFFNPVNIMALVELSYLKETRMDIIDSMEIQLTEMNKEVVKVKNSPGFIVNRLLIPMINEAAKILDEGIASVEDIDRAIKFGANHPMGPLKLSDLIGNDITLAILKTLQKANNKLSISESILDLNKKDYLGRKTGLGFYNYKK